MAATKDSAFVLRTQDYRDTSLLAQFYTREHGKVQGIIKGIRDTRARFGGTVEPFSLNEILFYKKRRGGDLHLVTQIECLELYPKVREDLERLAYASYFVELLNEFSVAEDPSPEIFDLLNDSLVFLGSGASVKRSARIFEIKLFELLGLMPEIRACVICRVQAPEPAYFNASLGGIHCRACGSKAGAEAGSVPLSQGAVHFLEQVMSSEIKELGQIKASQEIGKELERMLKRFVEFHLTRPLKSLVFIQKMGFN